MLVVFPVWRSCRRSWWIRCLDIKTVRCLPQSLRSLRCSTSLWNRWRWTRATVWVSGVTSAARRRWRSSGWRTGRTWRLPAAPRSVSPTGRRVWRSAPRPDTTPAITSARPPTTPAASSVKPRSPSKVRNTVQIHRPYYINIHLIWNDELFNRSDYRLLINDHYVFTLEYMTT